MDELVFELKLVEKDVKITNGDGIVLNCKLRELTGQERDEFLNTMLSKMRTDAQGKPIGMKSYDGIEAQLISMSLWKPEGKRFDIKEVRAFPSRVQKLLFKAAQELSGLDEKAEETAKND